MTEEKKKKPLETYTEEDIAEIDAFADAFVEGLNNMPEKDRPKEKE